jgi:ketosteroid isomerase-like protein
VIAAERAFAASAGAIGWIPAFCAYSASDAQAIGRAGLIEAHARMCSLADDGERNLYWAPAYAGVARSDDLGFTTGPASFDAARTPAIQYFTVWRRQADGGWKWIFDGGVGEIEAPGPYLAADAPTPTLPVSARGVGSAQSASAQVNAIEAQAHTPAALGAYLAAGAHVYRAGRARAYGGAAAAANLVYPVADIAYLPRRTEASRAGDLVFTLGEAHWTEAGGSKQGFYARIWQHQARGWRIVYDQLAPWTPPAAQ